MRANAVDYRLARRKILIALECGCRFRNHDAPFSTNAKYGCPSGLGHGYNVGWTEWVSADGGRTTVNPKHLEGN